MRRPALWPNQSLIQWVLRVLTPMVKTRREHELDQSPRSSAEVKNEWSCTSFSPFVSVAQCSIKYVHCTICLKFFGAFAKLRIATISFVMSVCLSVLLSVRSSARPPGTRRLPLNTLSRNLMFGFHCFTVHFDSLSFTHTNSCTFSYNHVLVF